MKPDLPLEPRGASGLELVLARAATDKTFREWLLREPREAIRRTFGVEPPARLRLRFIEKDPDVDLMFVLPDAIDTSATLTADEVERAAGGSGLWEWLGARG